MKQERRKYWKRVRNQISGNRRVYAENQLFIELKSRLQPHQTVLSFFSFGDEISMLTVNSYLAENNQLFLPKGNDNDLEIYRVTSPNSQCLPNKWGVYEPSPDQCQRYPAEEIAIILVPGLAFDQHNHRLGYGKGYYDRLLASTPPHVQSIGLGFQEQFSYTLLPIELHDIALDFLLLF